MKKLQHKSNFGRGREEKSHYGSGTKQTLLILIALPFIISLLLTIYHFVRITDLVLEISVISSSLRLFTGSSPNPENRHTNSCVITVAAWRKFGHVQTLYDSIQMHSPSIRCFVWFVADSVYHSTTDGSSEAVASIKQSIQNRFDIVTVDDMANEWADFDFMRRFTFTTQFTEDHFTALLTPFALQYTIQRYYAIDSVIYLDKHLWVNNTLEYIQMKLNTQAFTIGPSQSDPFNAQHVAVMAFSKKSPVTTKYLSTWMNELRKKGITPFHVIGIFEEEDWEELYDHPGKIRYWNLNVPQIAIEELPSSIERPRRPVLLINFSKTNNEHSSAPAAQQYPTLEEKRYIELLKKYETSYYEQLEFGFNYFSDGTLIESWIRDLYEKMIQPVLEHEDGTLVYSENSYTRIDFQDRVHNNPFLAKLAEKSSSSDQITFLEWLLLGPSTHAVNMDGKFYFSEVEHNVWKSLNYYPMNRAISNPLGEDTLLYKFWFEHYAHDNGLIYGELHRKVVSNTAYHRTNHASFHKSASSRLDLGINVIGWYVTLLTMGM